MNKVYVDPGIYYIENFIDDDTVKYINNFYDNNNNLFLKEGNFYCAAGCNLINEYLNHFFKKTELNLIKNVEDENNKVYPNNGLFQKYTKDCITNWGQEGKEESWAIPPHRDNTNYSVDDDVNIVSSRFVTNGYIIYFNDDYDGGEIFYLDKNISIKPKPKMLIVHDANILHGVKPVTKGERRFTTGFIYDRNYLEEWIRSK